MCVGKFRLALLVCVRVRNGQGWLRGDAAKQLPWCAAGPPRLPTCETGFWRDWDGTPFDEVPLFYHGMTDLAGQTLESIWGELKATNEGLAKALGLEEPPSSLRRVHSVVLERYSAVVGDPSTMLTSLRTNGAYAYTIHPVGSAARHEAGGGDGLLGTQAVLAAPRPRRHSPRHPAASPGLLCRRCRRTLPAAS